MKRIMENASDDDEIENTQDAELAPLRALRRALDNRIQVTTSGIQLVRNDPSTAEFVVVEGTVDGPSLQCLRKSISDLVTFPNADERTTLDSNKSEDPTDSIVSSEIRNDSKRSSDYSIPSCTSSFDGVVDAEALQTAESSIVDLDNSGPAGLVELSSLSDAIQQPIRVWISGIDKSRKVGRGRPGKPVDVEFHEHPEGEEIGHWTLRGNEEPGDVQGQLNDCLFSVVAEQTGQLAPELRAATVNRMRKNIKSLANRIEKIAKLEQCDRVSLLIGGARYTGSRPQDAGIVIDKSQHGRCHPNGLQGHPRGHASYPEATGPTESAENYSHTGMKSAFLSRDDQDAVGNLALRTEQAKRAMERLNRGETSIAIHVRPHEMEADSFPRGSEFSGGRQISDERPFRELVLVLRHHQGQQNDPDADVFVHTFYPVLE